MKSRFTLVAVVIAIVTLIGLGQTARASEGLNAVLTGISPSSGCAGSNYAVLSVVIQGQAPFELVYSDGMYENTVFSESRFVSIQVYPELTTTYSLVSVMDGDQSFGSVEGSVTFEVMNSPQILQDLSQNLWACNGEDVTLSFSASGDNLVYQWFKNDVAIESESSQTSSLYLPAVSAADVASYRCEVYGMCSDGPISTITCNLALSENPNLVSDLNSQDLLLCRGSSLSLQVEAEGAGVQYQWRLNGMPILENKTANEASLFIESLDDTHIGMYDCLISSRCGSGTILSSSVSVQLQMNPQITDQPVSQSVCLGHDVQFSAQVIGSNVILQWRKNGEAIVENASANTAQLLLPSVDASDAAIYDLVVSNACNEGSVYTERVSLEVFDALAIEGQSSGVSLCKGAPLTLHVDAVGRYPMYQWTFNGEAIVDNPSATTPTLVIDALQENASGIYQLDLTDACTNLSSMPMEVTVLSPARIEQQPKAMTICSGANLTLDIEASGSVGQYKWFFNDQLLENQTGAELQILAAQTFQSGRYRCQVFGPIECSIDPINSEEVVVNVIPATAITKQPTNVIAAINGEAVFFVETNGTGNTDDLYRTYQWYRGTTMLSDDARFEGSTTPQLRIRSVQENDVPYYYYCRVHGACGDVISDNASITLPPIVIDAQPSDVHQCIGSSVDIAISARTTQDISMRYQWYKNGQVLAGQNKQTLHLANLSSADDGAYYVAMVLGEKVSVYSRTISVKALTVPKIDPSILNQQIQSCESTYFTLTAATISGNDLQYQWYLNGAVIEGAVDRQYIEYSIQAAASGSYSVRVSNGCSNTVQNIANVTVMHSTVISAQPQAQTVLNTGQALALRVVVSGSHLQYQWYLNGRAINGATDAVYQKLVGANDAGMYNVRVAGDCGSAISDNALVLVNGVSDVSNDQRDGITLKAVSPNPASNSAHVDFSLSQAERLEIRLVDISGRTTILQASTDYSAGDYSINLDFAAMQIPSGSYQVQLISASGSVLRTQVVVIR